MDDKKTVHINNDILPFSMGMATYVAGRFLPFIPKDLSVFKTVKSSQLLGGLIDGLGNLRNISATVMGVSTTLLSHKIIEQMNEKNAIERPVKHDVPLNNEPLTSHVQKLITNDTHTRISR